jgi:hypothetical protein
MNDYPQWVLLHKKKGTYINHVKGKYYLYAAHSERIKGTKKVKRICDGYLGRITEKEGLIPTKDKVSGDVLVFEFGLCSTILTLCKDIHTGFKRSFKTNADFVMVASTLSAINGYYDANIFESSYLSIIFSSVDIDKSTTKNQSFAIERGALMIKDALSNFFGSNTDMAMRLLGSFYKVKINNRYYLSLETDAIQLLKQKYALKWENYNG